MPSFLQRVLVEFLPGHPCPVLLRKHLVDQAISQLPKLRREFREQDTWRASSFYISMKLQRKLHKRIKATALSVPTKPKLTQKE